VGAEKMGDEHDRCCKNAEDAFISLNDSLTLDESQGLISSLID